MPHREGWPVADHAVVFRPSCVPRFRNPDRTSGRFALRRVRRHPGTPSHPAQRPRSSLGPGMGVRSRTAVYAPAPSPADSAPETVPRIRAVRTLQGKPLRAFYRASCGIHHSCFPRGVEMYSGQRKCTGAARPRAQRRDPPLPPHAPPVRSANSALACASSSGQVIRSRTVYPMVRAALKIVGSMHSRLPPIAFHTHMAKRAPAHRPDARPCIAR